jgi:hypothetical protein
MMSRRAITAAALSLSLLLAPTAPLLAQDAPMIPSVDALSEEQQSQLSDLLELAEARFNEGDYGRALQYLQDAQRIFPHPSLLYQMALCYDRLGRAGEARDHYSRFLAALPNAPEAPDARRALDALVERRIAQSSSLRVESNPPGAIVYINDVIDGRAGTTPTADLPLPPGRYKIIVERDGFTTREDVVEVVEGIPAVHRVTLERSGPIPDLPGERSSSTVPWVLGGVGVLALGSAVTFGLLSTDDALSNSKQNTYETVALISGGVAIVSLGAALVLVLTDGKPTEQAVRAPKEGDWTPFVWAAPSGGGAGFTLNF